MRPLDDPVGATSHTGANALADEALGALLGRPVAVHDLRALCAAWADWYNDDDDHTAGEGMRALPDEERDAAFRFFADPEPLARFGEYLQSSREAFDCFAHLDPAQGPYLDAERCRVRRSLRELDEGLERGRRTCEQVAVRRQQAFKLALLQAHKRIIGGSSSKPAKPACPAVTPRKTGRAVPRRREHRSTTRRTSASRAGPDDPAESEQPSPSAGVKGSRAMSGACIPTISRRSHPGSPTS